MAPPRDGLKPVAELDGSGNLLSTFVYGSNPNVPDYMVRGGKTYRILTDQVGSVRMVVDVADSTNDLTRRPFVATYTAFGEARRCTRQLSAKSLRAVCTAPASLDAAR